MATITKRATKGSPLTNDEVDANFENLNTDKLETSGGSVTGDISFGDNDKAIFGAGSDLQIYHDGSNSRIGDVGAGNLWIYGDGDVQILNQALNEYKARFITDGAVELYYNGNQKLATTISGIDVTGTVTADGLTVDTDTLYVDAANNRVGIGTSSPDAKLDVTASGGQVLIDTNGHIIGKQSLDVISAGGRFTGESNRGALGSIHIEQTTTSADGGYIQFRTSPSGSTTPVERMRLNSDGSCRWTPDGTNQDVVIKADGKVGIGTSNPSYKLHVRGADATANLVVGNTTEGTQLEVFTYQDDRVVLRSNDSGNTARSLAFETGTTERMRLNSDGSCRWTPDGTNADMTLDASGNLLVGKTVTTLGTEGTLIASGQIQQTKSAGAPLLANRTGSGGTENGTVIDIRSNSATVGLIGTKSGDPFISNTATGIKFTNEVEPCTNNGENADTFVDLGSSSNRFGNLYLSGGVYLGGTGAANKLDDYEEGTWTPTLLATSSPSVTYSEQVGQYTKIGQLVYFNLKIATNGVSGGSGAVRIGGLPFAHAELAVGSVVASQWVGERPTIFRLVSNLIFLYYRTSFSPSDFVNSDVSDLQTAAGGFNVTEITGVYRTTS